MQSELKNLKTCSERRDNILTIIPVLKTDDLSCDNQAHRTDLYVFLPLTRITDQIFLVDGVDPLILWFEEDPSHVGIQEPSCRCVSLGCSKINRCTLWNDVRAHGS